MIRRTLHVANLPREICHHLIGPKHTTAHRLIAGLGVMVVGVLVAHSSALFPHYAAFALDTVGFSIHGLGLVPYIQALALE